MPDITPPNYPSPTHDFTLQAVMHMQETVGKLVEAVNSLKEQVKEQGAELRSVGKDVHAARIVGGVLVAIGGLIGWVIHELIQYLSSHGAK
jgi:uncharacterized membrane-anchored protein YjiN (DUF445 family)